MRTIGKGLLLMALMQLPLYAQQQNIGAIKGTVTDSSGLAVVGASVAVRHQQTGVETKTVTNGAGLFEFGGLEIGGYALTVRAAGFKTAERPDIRLVAGTALTIDVPLSLGQVTQTVSVSAKSVEIDTSSTTMGTTVTSETLTNLPLQLSGGPRSSLSFLATLSTVNYNPSSGLSAVNSANYEGSSGYGQNNYAGYSIDGVNASYIQMVPADNAPLIPEAVDEVRMASNFNSDLGWNGSVQVEVVSKSGTNQFHGSAFEWLRNNALDSRNWFAKRASPEKQNEYGFTLGGPIRKNKTFVFGYLDIFSYRTATAGVVTSVPTAAMRNGDFSALLGSQTGIDALGRPIYQNEIYDPATTRQLPDGSYIRDPFMYNGQLNVISPSQFSPVSAAFQNAYPLPTTSGTQNNWVGSDVPTPIDVATFHVKLDHEINERQRLMVSVDVNPKDNTINGGSGLVDLSPQLSTFQSYDLAQYRLRANYTWTIRPNLVFLFNFGGNDGPTKWKTPSPGSTFGAKAGLTGVYTPNTPDVSIQNTQGFGSGDYYSYNNPDWTLPSLSTNLNWIKGKHDAKFGFDFMQVGIQENGLYQTAGVWDFSNRITGLPNNANTGWGYASFLLGQVDNASLTSPFNVHYEGRGWAFYGQDQWRATSKLTVNYGLRWNFGQPPWEEHNRYGEFEPNVPNPAAGGRLGAISFWGTGPGLNGYRLPAAANYAMLDPRLGLAYSVDKNTVVRAYYGIISKQVFADFNEGTTTDAYGASATLSPSTTNNGVTPAFNWDNGFPGPLPVLPNLNPSFLNGQSVHMLEPNNNKGDRIQSFGLNVERALPWDLIVRGEYLGKMTHGIIRRGGSIFPPINQINPQYLSLGNVLLDDINSPQAQAAGIQSPYAGFKGDVAQALRPYPQFLNIDDMDSTGGFTEYDAAHFGLQKRFGSGLTFLVDYTWSKMLLAGPYQDQMQNTDKMLSTNNRPQILTVSYDYQLPFGRGKHFLSNANGALNRVVGGWEVSGVHGYFSGGVLQMSTTATIPTEERVWPLRVPGVPIRTGTSCSQYDPHNSSNRYLNVNAFATPAPFAFGDVYEPSAVSSCGYASENVAVMKVVPLTEKVQFKLYGNFFNLLNRHYWTGLGTNINNGSTFGTYNGATPPRTVQLGATLVF